MVQSPSWEANRFASSQEIPRISRNPKVHYCTHKRPPTVSILGQPNPVHIPTSHLLEIHPNIIHPSTPSSPQWSSFLWFPHQDPIHPLSSPIRATCPSHLKYLIGFKYYKQTNEYIDNYPTRCNTKQSIYYSASSLYMFRVSNTPIIRNTQNCNYSLRYWSCILCSYLPPTLPSSPGHVGGK